MKETLTVQDVSPSDFSRLSVHINHHEYNPKIKMPDPKLAELLGIPKGMNVGVFAVLINEELAVYILQHHNNYNRSLVEDRTYGMSEALKSGTFKEASPDSLIFDYNTEVISGQKRIKSITNAGTELNPKYNGAVWLRVEYGVDPDLRCITDISQPRSAADAVKFVADTRSNQRLMQVLNVAYSIYSGRSPTTLIGNVDDLKRLLGVCYDSLIWAAAINPPKGSGLQQASVRFALAQLHMQDAKKAEQVVQHLYFAGEADEKTSFIQPVAALKQYNEGAVKFRRAPLGARGGGTQAIDIYSCIVPFFDAVLLGNTMKPKAPEKKQQREGWSNPSVKAEFEAALNRLKVPNVRIITTMPPVNLAPEATSNQIRIDAQKHGVSNASTAIGAMGLINPRLTQLEAKKLVETQTTKWNALVRHGRRIYAKQPPSFYLTPASIAAFLFINYDHLGEVINFVESNLVRFNAILATAKLLPNAKKPGGAAVFKYLNRAYEAVLNKQGLPPA